MSPNAKNLKRLVLLDTHAILHRAYHALPEFTSQKGEPTGALYGLSAMLLKLINDLKPDYLIASYDLPGPTFRHEAYEGYKAKRPKTESDLVEQIERSRDILKAFSIPLYEKAGFEADDIIGTIVEQLKEKYKSGAIEIVIASGDTDTLQLVQDKSVQVYTLKKGLNDTILYDEEAVKKRFGFSPELLPDFKGLKGDPSDNIIGISGIGEKTATDLIQSFGTVENMYALLKKSPAAFKKKKIKERVIKLLEEGEEEALFSKTLASIRRDVPIDFVLPDKPWKESFAARDVEGLFRELSFRTLYDRVKKLYGTEDASSVPKISEPVEDSDAAERVRIAFWLLNSSNTNPTLDEALRATGTASLAETEKTLLKNLKANGLLKVYEEIELPLTHIFHDAEKRGIRVDTGYLKRLSDDYHKKLEKLEQAIWKEAGVEFNVNSPKQLGEVLFDRLKLSIKGLRKTEGGARSTRESELGKLKGAHPIIEHILGYRELQKLLSTYIDNIPTMVDKDGRLHTTFIQTGTTTGRISSMNPNLQNIPVKGEYGKEIRKAFLSDTGYLLCAFDYSQIELRVLAILSRDGDFVRMFKEGKDIHAAVASEVFKVPEDEVTRDMRRKAKVINFGIIYGMGVRSLEKALEGSREEAQRFYDNYFKEFPGVAAYMENVKREALKKGFTTTLFGRRRYIEGIRSPIPYIRAGAERMAINAPIQGSAADIIKLAMARVHDELKKAGILEDTRLLLQVHDELVYEVREKKVHEAVAIIKRAMEHIYETDVPLEVSVATGKDWGEL